MVSIEGDPQRGEPGDGAWRLQGPLSAASQRPPCAQVANGPEEQNYRSELHIFPASPGDPEDAQPAASRVKRAPSPSALAPGEWPPGPGPESMEEVGRGVQNVGVLHSRARREPREQLVHPLPKHTSVTDPTPDQ